MSQNVLLTLPILTLSIVALLVLLLDCFLPTSSVSTTEGSATVQKRSFFPSLIEYIPIYGILFALLSLLPQLRAVVTEGHSVSVFSGAIVLDGISSFFSFLICFTAMMVILLARDTDHESKALSLRADVIALFLFSLTGALVMVSAGDLITFFLGIEILSMSLYCLAGSYAEGSTLRSVFSAESALKYFFLGAFSSGFLLFGMALLYGATGSTNFAQIGTVLSTEHGGLVILSLAFFIFAMLFKVGVAPFHFWVPDVYQGSPTPITAYMASVAKIASIVALVKVLWVIFAHELVFWSAVLWSAAIISMVVGNFLALRSRSLKRILSYSSIAQVGYLLMALLTPESGGGALVYGLTVYCIVSLGAFAVVLILSRESTDERSSDDLTVFNGLAQRSPLLALAASFIFLTLAGLPPACAGLFSKFYLFSTALRADYLGLVLIAALNSAVALGYYLRPIISMYFLPRAGTEQKELVIPFGLAAAVTLSVAALVLLSLFPSVLFDGASQLIALR